MSTLDWAVFAALGMWAVAEVLKWYFVRHWKKFYINPKELVLPRLCPICLSGNVTEMVDEESSTRQTANYIIAREMTSWHIQVPYCADCKRKLGQAELAGFALGGLCVLGAFFVFPPLVPSFFLLCYILFGYPAYMAVTMPRKGIIFGFPNGSQVSARVRHPEYHAAMVIATHSVPPKKRVIAL